LKVVISRYLYSISLLLAVLPLYGQLDVRLLRDEQLAVNPQEVATFLFRLTNSDTDTLQITPEFRSIKSWRLVNPVQRITLAPGASRTLLVSFIPPRGTLAGVYRIGWAFYESSRYVQLQRGQLRIQVRESRTLRLTATSAPDLVLADSSFEAAFLLQNTGNIDQTVILKAGSGTIQGAEERHLAPGQVQRIIVEVPPRPLLTVAGLHTVRLLVDGGDGVERVHAYHHVRIFPTRPAPQNNGPALPGYLQLNYLGRDSDLEGRQGGLQGELQLAGHLDSAANQQLQIQLRGPDRFGISALGQFEAYTASYRGPDVSVTLGDQSVGLTPLTEFARFGRGVLVNRQINRLSVKGYYLDPRFFDDIKWQVGTAVKYELNQRRALQLAFLRKQQTDEQYSDLVSVTGTTNWGTHTNINLKLSRSYTDNGTTGSAGFIQLESRPVEELMLNGQLLLADANYDGYYRDTYSGNLRFNYKIKPWLSTSGALRRDARNIAQDTLLGRAPASDLRQLGLAVRPLKDLRINAFYRQSESQDLLPERRFHTRSQTTLLRAQYEITDWRFMLNAEYGSSQDVLRADEAARGRIYLLSGRASWYLGKRLQVGADLQWSNQDLFLLDGQQQVLLGVNARASLNNRASLYLSLQNNYALQDYYRDRDLARLDLRLPLGERHEFGLSGRYALLRQTIDNRDIAVQASYRYSFNLPLVKGGERCSLSGQLIGLTPAEAEGIILYLDGKPAVTDREGRFEFRGLPPGTYSLLIDASSTGMTVIPAVDLPLRITVEPDLDNFIAVPMTESARLRGSIYLEPKQSIGATGPTSIGPAMIELRSDTETRRQLVREDGQYEFRGLQPGTWKVVLIHPDLGKELFLANNSMLAELARGEQAELNIALRRKERTVRFMDFSLKKRPGSADTPVSAGKDKDKDRDRDK